jgi:hypothetical protein
VVRWITVRNELPDKVLPVTVAFDRLVASVEHGKVGLGVLSEVAVALTTKASSDERNAHLQQLRVMTASIDSDSTATGPEPRSAARPAG